MERFDFELVNDDNVKSLCEKYGVDRLVFTNFVAQLKQHEPSEKKAV